MKLLFITTVVLLILNSCNDGQLKRKQSRQSPLITDSTISKKGITNSTSEIPEPFEISQIDSLKALHFTSGMLSKKEFQAYCDNPETGIYGRYNLIDPNSDFEHPEVGIIDIYKPDKETQWQASDRNQKIWKIHLKSDVITLWDAINIGLSIGEVSEFGWFNTDFCLELSNQNHICKYDNYSVRYSFQNDTLTELTVLRNCKE